MSYDAINFQQKFGLLKEQWSPRVIAERHEKYEPRVDMWGAITYSDPLTCETLTSQQRKKINNPKRRKRGVKGYTKPLVKNFSSPN